MKLRFWCLLTLCLTFLSLAQAKTLLISDIDDTIKNSHVLSRSGIFWNAVEVDNVVLGMNKAYDLLDRNKQVDDLGFVYLSNGTSFPMSWLHTSFLSRGKFPAGTLLLRDSFMDQAHKLESIKRLIESEKPDRVILVGDNGEGDPLIYAEAVKSHPEMKFYTYIHQPYYSGHPVERKRGKLLQPGQKGFATSLELVLTWLRDGLVDGEEASAFASEFSTVLDQELLNGKNPSKDHLAGIGPLALPFWFDCRDVEFDVDNLRLLPEKSQKSVLLTLEKIQSRCKLPGSWSAAL